MKKNLLLLCYAMLINAVVYGQSASPSVVNSSGGEGQSASMSITWSVGEIMTETFQQGDLVLTQGVLQPDIIITAVEEITGLQFDIQVFPNPVRNHITIRFDAMPEGKTTWSLFDLSGSAVKTGILDSITASFSVEGLPAGVYFLRIAAGHKDLKVFKVVKQ